jgi:hypothetical protein
LDLPPESVGVGEAGLYAQAAGWYRLADMRLAGERGDKRGSLLLGIGLPPIARHVVDKAGGGIVDQSGCDRALRAAEELIDFLLGEIGAERRRQTVAGNGILVRLSHYCGADDHAERVEGEGSTIPVGVHHQRGLQDAIVLAATREWLGRVDVPLAHGDAIAQCVARLLD